MLLFYLPLGQPINICIVNLADAQKLVSDNLYLVTKFVTYFNQQWQLDRMYIRQIDIDNYIVKADLSQSKTVGITVPFEDPKDFLIVAEYVLQPK